MPSGVRVVDEISQQADVLLTNLQNDQILIYNSSTQKWENRSVALGSTEFSKTFTYDINNRLSSIVDHLGTKTFSYNLDGSIYQITGTGSYPTKTFSYDISGRLLEIIIT